MPKPSCQPVVPMLLLLFMLLVFGAQQQIKVPAKMFLCVKLVLLEEAAPALEAMRAVALLLALTQGPSPCWQCPKCRTTSLGAAGGKIPQEGAVGNALQNIDMGGATEPVSEAKPPGD